MKSRVGIAAIAALLWGCAATPEPRILAACSGSSPNNADCDIMVIVNTDDSTKICEVKVASGLNVVTFEIPQGQKKKIQWTLNTTDFTFRPNGIEFKDTQAPFEDPKVSADGSTFTVKNKGKKRADRSAEDYFYGIHLERVSDKMPCGFDPLIRNQ